MLTLTPLLLTGQDVRNACLPGMQASTQKDRLTKDFTLVNSEEIAMRAATSARTHRTLTPTPFAAEVRSDMKWFYVNRLRESKPGGAIYSRILDIAGRLCPLCHLSKPRTLEHSFPQNFYPRLAVEPQNLVPACRDCNSERNSGHGTITISPYFDSWAVQNRWLGAEVVDLDHPEDLRFRLERNLTFTNDQWNALEQFASDIDLLDRYVGLAIEAFAEFRESLNEVYSHPTTQDALSELNVKVKSNLRSFGINRWQSVAFETWLRDAHRITW